MGCSLGGACGTSKKPIVFHGLYSCCVGKKLFAFEKTI
jgi:hypothetical protein